MSPSDDELRARFDRLREEDHGRAPDFRATLDRAVARPRIERQRRVPMLVWPAAAAAVVLAVGLARRGADRDVSTGRGESVPAGTAGISSIADWRSPTDGLLRAPGGGLLAPAPITSSVLDRVVRADHSRDGDIR